MKRLSIFLVSALLAGCGSSDPVPEEATIVSAEKAAEERGALTIKEVAANREALRISRRLNGEPEPRLRLTKPDKNLQSVGSAPGIIIPGVDDLSSE